MPSLEEMKPEPAGHGWLGLMAARTPLLTPFPHFCTLLWPTAHKTPLKELLRAGFA